MQAARSGKSVRIVCPDTRLGGLTTGGLGYTDAGNTAAIGAHEACSKKCEETDDPCRTTCKEGAEAELDVCEETALEAVRQCD